MSLIESVMSLSENGLIGILEQLRDKWYSSNTARLSKNDTVRTNLLFSTLQNEINRLETRNKELEKEKVKIEKTNVEIENLRIENKKLHEELKEYRSHGLLKKDAQIDLLQDIGIDFVDKMRICRDISKFLIFQTNNQFTGGISGSLIRQLFELPYLLSDLYQEMTYKSGFGNPINHDVDIIVFDAIDNPITAAKRVTNIMEQINKHIDKITFGNYIVKEIVDVTIYEILPSDAQGRKNLLNIPHYQMKLVKKPVDSLFEENHTNITIDLSTDVHTPCSIIVDIIGWRPTQESYVYKSTAEFIDESWPGHDFSVNTMTLTPQGIKLPPRQSLFDILHDIEKHQAKCLIPLSDIHKKMVIEKNPEKKMSYLQQLIFFLGTRTKILQYGYQKIIGDVPLMNINKDTKEFYVMLDCGHEISYTSLTNDVSKYFNYKCSKCHRLFKIKFVNNYDETADSDYDKYSDKDNQADRSFRISDYDKPSKYIRKGRISKTSYD